MKLIINGCWIVYFSRFINVFLRKFTTKIRVGQMILLENFPISYGTKMFTFCSMRTIIFCEQISLIQYNTKMNFSYMFSSVSYKNLVFFLIFLTHKHFEIDRIETKTEDPKNSHSYSPFILCLTNNQPIRKSNE